ncbi:MAG: metallophosphoesterase [Clostridia bacterium]|nr:metallophosphoesterase [Clostridia bacterium]
MKKILKKLAHLVLAVVLTLTPIFVCGCGDDGVWIKTDKYPQLVLGRDYDYALAVVGDTQYLTQYDAKMEKISLSKYPHRNGYLARQYKWIANNASSIGIKYVLGMGDITHNDVLDEWVVAGDAIHQLDGVVPYSLVRGNHDNRTRYYDDIVVSPARYSSQESIISTYPTDTSDRRRFRNTIHEFSAGGNDYLIVCLDFGAQDMVLDWANGVVGDSKYANHQVFVTTHAYAYKDGELLDGTIADSPSKYNTSYSEKVWNSGVYGQMKWEVNAKLDTTQSFNDGTDIWNKFIKKHANIKAVFCGHVLNKDINRRQVVGDNGNIIHQFVVNPQAIDDDDLKKLDNGQYDHKSVKSSLTGMVAIYYFSSNGEKVTVRYYSTIKNRYYGEVNQFSFTMGDQSVN